MIPKELISYFVENANESSSFKLTNSNDDPRISSLPELAFPSSLVYNYESRLWESFYTNLHFKGEIPWYRQSGSRPICPNLDDVIIFQVDAYLRTVTLLPYSSNECSIMGSFNDENINQCELAHFWCRKEHMIIYQGHSTFDESIAICKGTDFLLLTFKFSYQLIEEQHGLLTTPTPKDVKLVFRNLTDDNGLFKFWTAIKRMALNEWTENDRTYSIADIIVLLEQMEQVLLQKNESITLHRE